MRCVPVFPVAPGGGDHLPGDVVAVLLRPEPAPAVVSKVRKLRAEDSVDRRVAVRDVRPGDLVVAVVLAKTAARRVAGGGGIAPLCQPADRLVVRIGAVDGDLVRLAPGEGHA